MSYTTKNTGGEYVHKLSVSEMPYHGHIQTIVDGSNPQINNHWRKMDSSKANKGGYMYSGCGWLSTGGGDYVTTIGEGGSNSHNNVQPYIVCYFWRRIS